MAAISARGFLAETRASRYNRGMDAAMTLSPELKQAVREAGDEPVRMEDPETQTAYVVIREDLYRKLRDAVPESDWTLHEFEELIPLE